MRDGRRKEKVLLLHLSEQVNPEEIKKPVQMIRILGLLVFTFPKYISDPLCLCQRLVDTTVTNKLV